VVEATATLLTARLDGVVMADVGLVYFNEVKRKPKADGNN